MFNLPGFNLLMALLLSLSLALARAGGGEDLLLRSHTNTHHTRGQQQLRWGRHAVMVMSTYVMSCVSWGVMSMQHIIGMGKRKEIKVIICGQGKCCVLPWTVIVSWLRSGVSSFVMFMVIVYNFCLLVSIYFLSIKLGLGFEEMVNGQ